MRSRKFIEWEMENNPHAFDKPRSDLFIDKRTLTHIISNVDCPEGIEHTDFMKVMNEVAEVLDLFPYFDKETIR